MTLTCRRRKHFACLLTTVRGSTCTVTNHSFKIPCGFEWHLKASLKQIAGGQHYGTSWPGEVGTGASKKPLKVLLISDYGSPSGGAELQMLALKEHLISRGHDVRFLSSDVMLHGVATLADRTCKGYSDRRQVLTQTLNLSAFRALRRELREHPPDVVHIRMFLWQLSPLILTALRDVPVLFQAAVYKAVCPNGLKILPDATQCTSRAGYVCYQTGCVSAGTWISAMAQLAMLRRWRQNIDAVATLSQAMARIFEENGFKDVLVLPNGIDEAPYCPSLSSSPLVAYAGRLSREKGLDVLFDAFDGVRKRLPGARLLVVGTGPLEDVLRRRARGAGSQVQIEGQLEYADLQERLQEAWVQVVPSVWQEPFGNVSLEAMIRGTAVVASDVGGQSELVDDGRTGYLVRPGDVEMLTEKLLRLVTDRAHAEALGQAGRQKAQAFFTRRAAVDRIEQTYEKILASAR
ncbi:glycosyltransferase family 4 protein [Ovoidimarina sediminis]|uniref:glycosyltransferase family 4 protein n=1 Tax=Ovoidimarina sediminis TaxID=3079856 RepID=UPI00292F3202|nr:glycosyltransferase family 4 protein [Rhodophyticola sp. MJ-SS7]